MKTGNVVYRLNGKGAVGSGICSGVRRVGRGLSVYWRGKGVESWEGVCRGGGGEGWAELLKRLRGVRRVMQSGEREKRGKEGSRMGGGAL